MLANVRGVAQAVAILDLHIAAFSPTQLLQALRKGRIAFSCVVIARDGTARQHTDAPHALALLRARRARPRRCAAEQRDDLAPRCHSITSSARARRVAGMSRPSALAVLRLITSSYLVGACTGRSAG